MLQRADKPGLLTIEQAARKLGVSCHQVNALVRSGELPAQRPSARATFVDAASLSRYALLKQGRGRPLNAKTAFAALFILSGLDADWLSYAQARRLAGKMAGATPADLAWQARKRARRDSYRMHASLIPRAKERLLLSGASAAAAPDFDLVEKGGVLEGYLLESEVDAFVEEFFLVEDPSGNVAIHRAEWLPPWTAEAMPVAVVAADLAESLDTRERLAALDKLQELIDAYRNL